MKRGVLTKLSYVLLFLVIVSFLGAVVFAGYPTDSGSDDETPEEEEDYRIVDENRASQSAKGYWIAETGAANADTYSEATRGDFYYSPKGADAVILGAGSTVNSIYDRMKIEEKADGMPWEIALRGNNLYDYFNVPAEKEIHHVTFVLDPEVFRIDWAEETLDRRASHGGDPLFSWYQYPCIECENLDDITCPEDIELPAESSCIRTDILSRNDCSEMADYNQNFCEGATTTGANAVGVEGGGFASTGEYSINPTATQTPGFGGCQESPSTALTPRKYGRDWFVEEDGEISNGMKEGIREDAEAIGRCCGNDPEDEGIIYSVPRGGAGSGENSYMCLNATFAELQARRWLDAGGSDGSFIIRNVEREGKRFEVISNAEKWFVCGAPGSPALEMYEGEEEEDPLLEEYEILPPSEIPLTDRTEAFGEEEAPGLTEGVRTDETTPYDRDDGESRDDSVSEEEFTALIGEISGPSRVTACDKDGDGYDGAWTISETGRVLEIDGVIITFLNDESGTCDNPRPPFDCDDYSDDDAFIGQARRTHPGAINYCEADCEEGNCHFDCAETACIPESGEPGGEGEEGELPDLVPAEAAPRFICHNEDEKGAFAECCGWDLAYCINNKEGRREGSMIHTLRDFSYYGFSDAECPAEGETECAERRERGTKNYVLRFGIATPPPKTDGGYGLVGADDTYRLALFTKQNDIEIENWKHYETLEFYIWMTTNFEVEMWLGDFVPDKEEYEDEGNLMRDMNEPSKYSFPYKIKITDYVVNEPELNKWMHVAIPTQEIFAGGEFEVDTIVFASNVQRLMDLGTTVEVRLTPDAETPETYSNLVGVDKIFLKPKERDLPETEAPLEALNEYCTGSWPPQWIEDLDDPTPAPGISDEYDETLGKRACEAIPSYGWTGTQCCGDDTGSDTRVDVVIEEFGGIGPGGEEAAGSRVVVIGKTIGQDTEKEFYVDEDAGCWAGNKIANDERVMLVEYNMNSPGFDGVVQRSCKNNSCLFVLPPTGSILVQNPNSELYDLTFVNGGHKPIGGGRVSEERAVYLKAENVPLMLQYSKTESEETGHFYACNAEQAEELFSKEPISALISEGEEYRKISCEAQGIYFCEHLLGKNLGWSNEPLEAYPNEPTEAELAAVPERNTVYKLMNEDGTEEILLNSYVAPTKRTKEKRNYNLVWNGGFENG